MRLFVAYLHVQEIVDAICAAEASGGWKAELIPFCGDEETLYAINTKSGHVVEWEVGEGLGDTIAVSFYIIVQVLTAYHCIILWYPSMSLSVLDAC